MNSLYNALVRSKGARFIANNNPFYVLSAMCMLAGLFILNDSLHYNPIPASKLLTLIATLNIYEWFIIGLSVFLFYRGILRDGAMILLIEVFFLSDVAFLNSELFTTRHWLAWPVSILLILLAGAKLLVVVRTLDSHQRKDAIDSRTLRAVLACSFSLILLLFVIPGWLFSYANHHDGQVPPAVLYGIWWIVGILPALAAYLPGSRRIFALSKQARMMRAYILIPYLSLIAHIGVSHWVYKSTFYSEDLSPLLLGLAVLAIRANLTPVNRPQRIGWMIALPALAILLSISEQPLFSIPFAGAVWTPMRITFLASALVYVDGTLTLQKLFFTIPAAICFVLSWLGSSPQAIATGASQSANQTSSLLGRFLPSTPTQWGILSVISSFVLLAIGAAISLNRRDHEPVPIPPPQPEDGNSHHNMVDE
ncbi:MAG TPA: hypothetical protein VGG19_17325 [Tepidisphaeraceae bacterium]|jgi:hypothetical protein